MATTAETNIYNRLAAAPTFHPASADLFTDDWCLEPGDVVTVNSGSESYSVPVYSLSLDWKGASRTSIQSTGNQQRDSLTALKKKHYSGGYGGMAAERAAKKSELPIYTQMDDPFSAAGGSHAAREGAIWFKDDGLDTWGDYAGKTWADLSADYDWRQMAGSKGLVYVDGAWEQFVDHGGEILQGTNLKYVENEIALQAGDIRGQYAELSVTAREIRSEVIDARAGLSSKITQTAGEIRAEVDDVEEGLSSLISQTSDDILLVVNNAKDELQGKIDVQADRISLVVEGTGSNAHIKPASIVSAINNGSSSIVISADHINLDGYVTVSALNGVTAEISNLKSGVTVADYLKSILLNVSNELTVGSGITLIASSGLIGAASGYFSGTLEIGVSGNMKVGNTSFHPEDAITELQITGPTNNVYKLQRKRFDETSWTDVGSFSRATSLSGAWSGNTITVTASPQGDTYSDSVILNPEGNGSSNNFSIFAYHTSVASGNNFARKDIYLTEDVTNKNVKAKIDNAQGTAYAQVSTQSTYDAGFNACKSSISDSDIALGNRGDAGQIEPSGTRISAQNFGIPSNSYGYYKFTVTVFNYQKQYYFPYDTR